MKITIDIPDEQIRTLARLIAYELMPLQPAPPVTPEPPSKPEPPVVEHPETPTLGRHEFEIYQKNGKTLVRMSSLLARMAFDDDDGWLERPGHIENSRQGRPTNWIMERERPTPQARHAFIVIDAEHTQKGIFEWPNTIKVGASGLALKCRYRPGFHSRLANFKTRFGVNNAGASSFLNDVTHSRTGPKPVGW